MPSLDRLIERLSSLVAASTDALQAGQGTPDEWYDEVSRQLRRYTLAAYLNGSNQGTTNPAQRRVVDAYYQTQLDFLAAFRDEIKAAEEWSNSWNPRAQMYAESIKAPWWSGKTYGYPLPAMPGDGTSQCLTRCRCSWDVNELEGDGNADATWVVNSGETCQTCVERGQQWAPLRIRDGVLQ